MNELTRSTTFEARRAQMFPVLSTREMERLRSFAIPRSYGAGDLLFETGKPSPGMLVVLSGVVRISGRDGRGHDVTVVEVGAGQFTGEIGSLAGSRAFVDGRATVGVEALLITSDRLRAVLVAEADLGERIMRALILRRVALIETGAGGPVLIGSAASPDVARLRNFLTRNGIPYLLFDPATDPDAQAFVAHYAPTSDDLPLVACPDGSVLRNPAESVLGRCIGMLDGAVDEQVYDVAVAGAGPAGLATAVYAASEGLSVIVIDARAYGGQAGASARIENYLGFPTGISGMALAGRAYTQARKFGARMLIPSEIVGLHCERRAGDPLALHLSGGRTVRSRTVVIASGARYRRPDCDSLAAMEGHGVWYWASPIEAKMCAAQEVVLVGGGNSAGQAAVFLSSHAAKVWMLVRGHGLADSMSRYLIDRIAATSNIELLTRTEIVGLSGSRESGVEGVRWRNRDSGHEETREARNVFLFLGADPATAWLKECGVALDDKGFVLTGSQQATTAQGPMAALSLATSVPGVFAIGDVRSGSVKRVGGAIGEGAAVAAQLHAYLARADERDANAASGPGTGS